MADIARLRHFVTKFTHLVEAETRESALVEQGSGLLGDLVAEDDWLPEAFAKSDPVSYRQYLLHCDPLERFSVVSFVWGPGQQTPIHNHTVWGLIGVLRGGEIDQPYALARAGDLKPAGEAETLARGSVAAVSPTLGDIHRVKNAFADRTSISIHVYGANIGAVRRATFDVAGTAKPFVSGYNSALQPNLWDRSAEVRASS